MAESAPPSTAEPLLALLLANPRLHDCVQRQGGLDDARHHFLDTLLAGTALKAGWERAAIHAVLNTAHARVLRPPLPEHVVTLLLHEAAAHTEAGILDRGREALLENISKVWKIDILQVIRHGKENSVWSLRLMDGIEVHLGSSENFIKQGKVRAAIFDVTGKMIPKMTGKNSADWDYYLEIFADVAITVDTPELSRKGYILGLVHQYLDQQRCVLTRDADEDEWEALALSRKPFVREGALYVHAPSLHQFTHMLAPELTRAELLDLLRQIGGTTVKVNCWVHTPRTSRTYWKITTDQLEEELPAIEISTGLLNGTAPVVTGVMTTMDEQLHI